MAFGTQCIVNMHTTNKEVKEKNLIRVNVKCKSIAKRRPRD